MSARIVVIAHFPPPVHGMAVAMESLTRRLARSMTVRRLNIAAPTLQRDAGRHAIRIARVIRAVVVLATERRLSAQVLFSCDAGVGMIYTLLLVGVARALGYRIMLQHHSYAYLLRRSRLLAVLVRVGGKRVVHLVTAPQMQTDFLACYPGAVTRVVGIAQDLPLVEMVPTSTVRERLVLGFLGNVTLEKGIGLALNTVRAASQAGMSVELRVAGPVDADAAEVLAGADTSIVTLLGPVYGVDRDAFLDDIDVFLFPSQYSHESFGLAAWEAMARGRPLLAHRSGCLTSHAVGRGGLVIERTEDFAVRAIPVLQAWWSDPETLTDTGRGAHASAASMVSASREQIENLCVDLVRLAANKTTARC